MGPGAPDDKEPISDPPKSDHAPPIPTGQSHAPQPPICSHRKGLACMSTWEEHAVCSHTLVWNVSWRYSSKKAQDEVCFEWQWMRNAHNSAVWEVHVCTADDEPRMSMSKRVRDRDETLLSERWTTLSNVDVTLIANDSACPQAGSVLLLSVIFPHDHATWFPSFRLSLTRQPSLSQSEFVPGVRWWAFCQCTSVRKGPKLAFKGPIKNHLDICDYNLRFEILESNLFYLLG